MSRWPTAILVAILLLGLPVRTSTTATSVWLELPSESGNYVSILSTSVRYWNQPELTLSIAANAEDTVADTAEIRKSTTLAVAAWNRKLSSVVKIVQVEDNAASADISLQLATSVQLAPAIGRTTASFCPDDEVMVHAAILVTRPGYGVHDQRQTQAVMHEIGHALGMEGHSDCKADLMYPYSHLPAEITERDLNTLKSGYARRLTQLIKPLQGIP